MNTVKTLGWHDLPVVYVRLRKDELGYPPREWEELKAQPTDNDYVYQIKSIPFYARGLGYDDEVRVGTSEEGYYPVVESVSKRGGYSTMRLWIEPGEDRQAIVDHFTSRDCLLEFKDPLVAIAIPAHRFDEVSEYICAQKAKGRWDAEDGYLIGDKDPLDK